ncbi:MAG: serine/threonine protein kinase [Gemmatimonadota bacterium]|nr:MAG: serine/threonine protein kinase [Gemmatimonadota bacterium]
MTEPESTLLSTVSGVASSRELPAADTFPPLLLQQSVRRVRAAAMLTLGVMAVAWLLHGAIEGFLWEEFQQLGEWAPPTFTILVSALMYVVARSRRIPARTILHLALAYQVAVSFGVVFTQYWGAFAGFSADQIRGDTVGLSAVAVWMLVFTVLVPVRPRHAVIALLVSAAATPITYAIAARAGDAPVLPPSHFFWSLVFPYLVVAGVAYIMARIIYRLGQDVWRARELGSYRLERRLGQGGMGEVWRANHRMLARPAAVKLVSPAAVGDTPEALAEMLARFEREAQVTAELQSGHTVDVYDYGVTEDGRLYYVMELLDGIDLEHLVRRFGPLPSERVIHTLLQACDSLAEAHRRGLVHRDIKPGNIFLCKYAFKVDVVKVLDFGLAKHTRLRAADDVRLSQAEVIRGTPAYMAPELAMGEEAVDGRVDLYALGCVAYWLLTGSLVFDASSPAAMIVAHVRDEPVPPSRRSELPIPAELDELVLACLAKDRAARLQSAEHLASALAAVPLESPWTPARAAEWWRTHGLESSGPP